MVLGLFLSLMKYLGWCIIRRLLLIPQLFWWFINGTYFQMRRSKQIRNYDWSAHILTIHFRHKLDLFLQPSGPGDFITTHHSFQHPKYMLKDNVTLYCVTKTQAVFVESDPGVDVTHSKYGSFMKEAQFYNSRRIIVLPIHSFHKMAQEIGDVKGTIIFVSNTARCGSTLLNQIFEETGKSVAICQPDALNAFGAYRGKMPQAELDHLVISSIQSLCKPRKKQIDFYALKLASVNINVLPMLIRLFPNSKQVFMYREGLPRAQSCVKISTKLPLLGLRMLLTKISEKFIKKKIAAMGFSSYMSMVKINDPLVYEVYLWAAYVDRYKKLRQKGTEIVAIRYEDLLEYPVVATQAIFRYCGVPVDLVQRALGALNKDSQRLSIIKKKNLSKLNTMELTPQRKTKTDKICDKFGLPRIPEICVLDGTITHVSEIVHNGKMF